LFADAGPLTKRPGKLAAAGQASTQAGPANEPPPAEKKASKKKPRPSGLDFDPDNPLVKKRWAHGFQRRNIFLN